MPFLKALPNWWPMALERDSKICNKKEMNLTMLTTACCDTQLAISTNDSSQAAAVT
jgi:hypothetical protein